MSENPIFTNTVISTHKRAPHVNFFRCIKVTVLSGLLLTNGAINVELSV